MNKSIESLSEFEERSGSAAARKTYSAEELAEMFLASRTTFFELNLTEVTSNWNPNYIFDFLKCFDKVDELNDAIDWFILSWEEDHDYRETLDNIYSRELVEEYRIFCDYIQRFKEELTKRIENREKKAALKARLLNSSRQQTTTLDIKQANAKLETTQTAQPEFKPSQQVPDNKIGFRILLTDLPEEIQNIVVVSQNVFDVLVKQLNEDSWTIVETNKGYYCDPLRFLCNFYYITKRKTTREEFDMLLHAIVEKLKDEPSLVSSMGRCKLTSEKKIDRSYKCYACYMEIPKMKEEIWQLIEPCKTIEESLQPVLDAMKEEERAKSKQSTMGVQIVSTV